MEGVINRVARLARLGYFCCLGLVILAIFTINPVSISGDEANATTGTATSANTSLSLTTNHDNAVVTITPNSANGTFAMSSAAGEAQFGVTTNNFTGYELSIVADDDNGNLVNIDNGITHTISSIPSSITKSSFDTTTYNNKWGYKPNKYLGPNSTIVTNTGDSALFLPSPTTTGTILDHTTIANLSANNYSIALGVRADYNTYAGSYTKNFTLAVIANPTTYIIDYNKNTSDTVTNMPTAQSSATSATSITLAGNTPERENYNFLGWCTVQTVDSSCSGTTYQPGDTYGLDQTTANTATFYAMWEQNMTIQDVTSLQHFGSLSSAEKRSVLSSMATGQAYELADARDNETYNIAKLADGRVWLLDNLRLDLVNVPLADLQGKTNATDTSLGYLKNGGGTTSDKYATAGVREVSKYEGISSTVEPLVAASGYCSNSSYCVNDPSSGQWTKDSLVSYGDGTGKIGIYYNYCAASAGSYCYSESSYGVAEDVTEDICPAGWRMPTGSSATGEYSVLYKAYSNNNINFKNALHATLSGRFNVTNSYNYGSQNSSGIFWSSSSWNRYNTYTLYIYQSSTVSPASSFGRGDGLSVRCTLANPISYSISYNKNTTDNVSNMPSAQNGNSDFIITISNNTPSKTTGVFLGWCNVQPTTSNNIDSCPGNTYQPGDAISPGYLSLYAMWSNLVIQNVTLAACPTQPVKVLDSRDNEVYTIQKLADGKCWLLDNLRLDLTDPDVQNNLSSSNTNATDVSLGYLINGGGTDSDQYAKAGVANWGYADDNPRIATGGSCGNTSYCVNNPSSGQWTKDSLVSYGDGTGKIGIYYNYCAASAGSYCYKQGYPTDNATEDICPAGWRMPTGREPASQYGGGEYQTLYAAYSNNNQDFVRALRAINSGYMTSGYAQDQGISNGYGYFWSSSSGYSYGQIRARVKTKNSSNSSVNTSDTSYASYGNSVRCILDNPVNYTISYNKNTTDAVDNMPSSTQSGITNSVRPVTLLSDTPSRADYVFLGWCDTTPAVTNGLDSCSGPVTRPGGQYNISSANVVLYAMWAPNSSLMQNVNTCPTTPTLVADSRDGEIYTIQKLADGKCWLLDNLRLDLSTIQSLTTADTNITSDWVVPANITDWSFSSTDPKIVVTGKNVLADYGSGSGRIGVHYNYCAASAGTICKDSTYSNATSDICPKGWRMPTGGSSGEYKALYAAYSSNDVNFINALRSVMSGQGGSSGLQNMSSGYFWSSSYYNERSNSSLIVQLFSADSGSVGTSYQVNRSQSNSVRCVLK